MGGLSWFWVSHGGVTGMGGGGGDDERRSSSGWGGSCDRRDETISAQANCASITALIGHWGKVHVINRQTERREGGGGLCLFEQGDLFGDQ